MNELTKDQTTELQQLVKAAARRVAAQWPSVVEKDDLEQEIVLHLIERPGALARLFEEPEQQVRQSFLIKVGHQIASKEQQDYDRFSGNYLYDTAEVRGFLDRQIWTIKDKLSAEKQDLEEGLSILAERNSKAYAEIVNRFFHDIVPADSAGRMRVLRAIETLTELMNRTGAERRRAYTEGPGSRKAIPNQAMDVLTRTDHAGTYNDGRN